MSVASVNSGVRNLRAMFENKAGDQSTSPPSRGRSPNPSEISNFSSNSRPVSKVRASFVAVERPGENGGAPILGLRRTSEVSSMGGIQEHAIEDNEFTEKPPVKTTNGLDEGKAPAPPPLTSAHSADDEGNLGNILKGSAFVENTPSKPPTEPSNFGRAVKSGVIQNKIGTSSPTKPKDGSSADTMVEKMQSKAGSKPGPPAATELNATVNAKPVKALPTRQVNTKAVPKSPIVTAPSPRTPTSPKLHIKGGPGKIKGVMESAKNAQTAREPIKQEGVEAEKAQPPAPKVDTNAKPKPATAATKKEQTPASPKSVRSPSTTKPRTSTVPGKLPAAATATTASAAAKHDNQQSPTETTHKPTAKKTAALSSRPPRASTSSTTSTLAKKSSRVSLVNGHDRPKSRASTTKADEGFLARMMRPTASSAQKAHEKLPPSPPRTKKVIVPSKAKQAALKEAPSNTQDDAQVDHQEVQYESGADQKNQRGKVLPDVAHPSPSAVTKEEPVNADAEKEPGASEPTKEVETLNGEAPEVY